MLRETVTAGNFKLSGRSRIRLKDMGISWNQSSDWQREAALPDDAFEAYLTETQERGEELATAAGSRARNTAKKPVNMQKQILD